MPIVQLRFTDRIATGEVRMLARALTDIVANALTTKSVELKAHEISVIAEKFSDLDLNVKDLDVTIFATNFRERIETSEKRKDQILDELLSHIRSLKKLRISVCVRMFLVEESYGESLKTRV